MSEVVDVARWQGRKGRPWRRVVAATKKQPPVCHRCGLQIDMTLPPNHRMSYTTGHRRARSRGGVASVANARPEHRKCNSGAGDDSPGRRTQAFRRSQEW
ncbi:hypothetical protein C8E97_6797 [Saccharothrix australiensis]|uniref:HNH endonuclease n=1 Tax=Saccharothrix australiensis TaxID=2072 RepID=A0A495VIT8_9PSEU|nr:hypothetical protein C8E97_6797 [Saccharothrix australiensis]